MADQYKGPIPLESLGKQSRRLLFRSKAGYLHLHPTRMHPFGEGTIILALSSLSG